MSSTLFHFDNSHYPGVTLYFQVQAIGNAGATEGGVQGPNKYPPKALETNGSLLGYAISAPAPGGTDPAAPRHYYTVRTATGDILDSRYFVPVQTSTGVVDIDQLTRTGQAVAATPEQVAALSTLVPQVQGVLSSNTATVEQIRSVAATRSLGRPPQAGDPAGLYRFASTSGTVDIAWNGSAETGRTPVLATNQQLTDAFGVLTRTGLAAYDRQGRQTVTADGSPWLWLSDVDATAQGKTVNGGTVIAALGGGVWVRMYRGPILPQWFGVPVDGTDATPAMDTLIAALKTDDKVDFGSATYTIITAREWIISHPRIDLIANGATFEVAAAARLDYWNSLFRVAADDVRLLGRLTINCNVPDAADETASVTGANGYIQRGAWVVGAQRIVFDKVYVTKPLSEGLRGYDGSSGTMSECDVTHRSGYTDVGRTSIAASRSCIEISSTGYAGADAAPGTNGFIPWMDRTRALPQITQHWTLDRCKVRGGTHGYNVFNAAYVVARNCEADDNSHRNFLASPTADYVQVIGGHFSNAGSTNIHFANGCRFFVVQGATADTTLLAGLEGDGIKAYVGCTDGIFSSNIVKNALWHGIRVAFGVERVNVSNNLISMADGRSSVDGTIGVAVMSRTHAQADGYAGITPAFVSGGDNSVRNAYLAMKSRTQDITVTGNSVYAAQTAYAALHEANSTSPNAIPDSADTCEVTNVMFSANTAMYCFFGFSAADVKYGGGSSNSGYVHNLVLTDLTLRGCANTAYTVGVPPFVYFKAIRGVPHVGTGFVSSSLKITLRDEGSTAFRGAGAPASSGPFANSDTYVNETTGEQYRYQSGAWVKVTAA